MNKKLLGVIIGVVAIVVIVVVLGVTFVTRHVTIDTTSTLSLTDEEIKLLASESGIQLKASILSVDEAIVINNIETRHPSLKVISVERKFPDTVCVNITNRTPVYSIKVKDGTYAILDRELKVVNVVENLDDISYITKITGYELSGVQAGGIMDIKFLSEITDEAENLSFVNQRMSSFIPSIEYLKVDNGINNIMLKTNTGVVLVIKEVTNSMGSFFNYAYTKYYNELTKNQRSTGYVYLTDENVWTWSDTYSL